MVQKTHQQKDRPGFSFCFWGQQNICIWEILRILFYYKTHPCLIAFSSLILNLFFFFGDAFFISFPSYLSSFLISLCTHGTAGDNLLHSSSVIHSCNLLLLHLIQKQKSRTMLQLSCPFSRLFPTLVLKCIWLDFTHLALSCTFVSHTSCLPAFHEVFREWAWCKKFTWTSSEDLLQRWRRIWRERTSSTVRMASYIICVCIKGNRILFPYEFLFTFKLFWPEYIWTD